MIKSYITAAEVPANRLVRFSGGAIVTAESSSDYIVGISGELDKREGYTADVYHTGEVAHVISGGAFSAGDALTSNSEGRAVSAASGDNIGAIALADAQEEDELVQVLVCLQRAAF